MTAERENLLNHAYKKIVDISFNRDMEAKPDAFFTDDVMLIGTAKDELLYSSSSLMELIKRQREQTLNTEINLTLQPTYSKYLADDTIAIIVETGKIVIAMGNEKIEFDVRSSAIMQFDNASWKLVHWHVSKPENVQSEEDTFGIAEWKHKTEELEKIVAERTAALQQSLEELKSTQAQLIHQEKMASLGELTAGIAHEIQNPLNFVNNFSEVNREMLEELKAERLKPNADKILEDEIINDVIDNEEKINHHGKRADAIVKGMLQHSRKSEGKKEPTDINALCDEYLRLSYHGLRAKDKTFNADFKTNYDNLINEINVVPQDIGRVLLNLINNAFYAVNEKKKTADENYQPTVSVQTKKINDKIEIIVSDNGNGIPSNIIDKIFQPFFTTKPTGQGTGLGLSLAYDIITKEHNGTIKAESKEGEGTRFIIQLAV